MTDTRRTTVITLEGARKVLDRCIDEAATLGVPVVVVVCDPAGEMVTFGRMDGAPMLSVGVARDKAWTVAAFGRPTHWWAELFDAQPGLSALGNGRPLMPVPGGVPIVVGDVMVGSVGVSGGTAAQDRLIAEAGAGALSA